MIALVTVLAQAYSDPVRGLAPLQRAGIAREHLHTNQAARPFWEQSLDLAERLGLLQRVVEIATTDPTIAAFHRPISFAYEAHLTEQAADAAPHSTLPPPIDPGAPASAPFVPTLEQAHHSATCAALYSRGATERQALDFLYRETVELRAQLIKLAESAPVPMVIADGYARGRDDERRRCTRHAHALTARAFAGAVGYPAVLATAEAISSGKAAP